VWGVAARLIHRRRSSRHAIASVTAAAARPRQHLDGRLRPAANHRNAHHSPPCHYHARSVPLDALPVACNPFDHRRLPPANVARASQQAQCVCAESRPHAARAARRLATSSCALSHSLRSAALTFHEAREHAHAPRQKNRRRCGCQRAARPRHRRHAYDRQRQRRRASSRPH